MEIVYNLNVSLILPFGVMDFVREYMISSALSDFVLAIQELLLFFRIAEWIL